jgi:hypothetical protein
VLDKVPIPWGRVLFYRYTSERGERPADLPAAIERSLTGMCRQKRHALHQHSPALSGAETNLLAASAPAYVVFRPTLMQVDAIRQICFLASRHGATHAD